MYAPMILIGRVDRAGLWQKVERKLAYLPGQRHATLDLNRGMVSFTFDDVYQSACRRGREILERHDCKGTYYICGGCTGLDSPSGRYHTRQDLFLLKESRHELACHGFAHHNYQVIPDSVIREDLAANRRFFRDEIGLDMSPRNFAYPFGCVSPRAKRLIGETFLSARGGKNMPNIKHIDFALLKSMQLYQQLWTHSRMAHILTTVAKKKAWLIFVTHDVLEEPYEFGCKPSLLDFAITQAKALGLKVLPINEALNQIGHAT